MKTISHFVKHLCMILGATTLLFSASAQNQPTLTPIGKWPEYPQLPEPALRVAGSYAYLAGSPPGYGAPVTLRLLTLDVGDPSQPRYVGCLDTATSLPWSPAVRMDIRGACAYVILGSVNPPYAGVLAVFSLSQPAAPTLVGTCSFTGGAWDMEVAGNYVYVAASMYSGTWTGKVLIIDISNPAQPTLVRTVYTDGVPRCVSLAGNYLYAGGNAGEIQRVDIIDVSDPSRAVLAGGVDIPEAGYVTAIAAQGSRLHLCDYLGQFDYQVFDLSDPLYPVPLARYDPPRKPECPTLIHVAGNLVYVGTTKGLCVLDLVDPLNPQEQALVPLKVDNWFSVDYFDLGGQSTFWHDGGELRVLDVKRPDAPLQVGQFDTGFQSAGHSPSISTEGDLAYLLAGQRLRVLNISNPRAPALVGAEDLDAIEPGIGAWDLKVAGQHGYVLAESFLQILDLSNVTQPVEAGRISVSASGLDIVGDRAYVTVGNPDRDRYDGWLKVFDISNAAAPVEVGSMYFQPDGPGDPQVVGDFAYLSVGDDLGIVDIRDPSQMVEVGRYHPPYRMDAFQVVGRYAYVSVSVTEQSLHIVDLADPAHPTRVGRLLYDPGTVLVDHLCVSGGYAFVTLRRAGGEVVDILDVRDPTRPVKAGEYSPEGLNPNLDMVMVGTTLYTVNDAGLTALDFYAPNTSPNLRLNTLELSGGVAVLTWEGGPGIKLQKTTSLTRPDWQDVPNTEGKSLIAMPPTDTAAFFRLTMPLTQP